MKTHKSNNPSRMKRNNAFTIVEMTLVVSLIAIVGLALYQSIANGLRIWEKAKEFRGDEDIAIVLDKISLDLRNTVDYSLIKFDGNEGMIEIPTLVRVLSDKKSEDAGRNYISQIGQVKYYFDRGKRGIFVRKANYSQAIEEKFGEEQLVASSIQGIRFRYYYTEGAKTHIKQFANDGIPGSVKLEIDYLEKSGRKRTVSRIMNIPVGDNDA